MVLDLEIWILEIALLTRCGDELGVWGTWNVHVIGGQVHPGVARWPLCARARCAGVICKEEPIEACKNLRRAWEGFGAVWCSGRNGTQKENSYKFLALVRSSKG